MKRSYQILTGDLSEQLKTLKDNSVNCIMTSANLFDVENKTQSEAFIRALPEIRRVLKNNGILWLQCFEDFFFTQSQLRYENAEIEQMRFCYDTIMKNWSFQIGRASEEIKKIQASHVYFAKTNNFKKQYFERSNFVNQDERTFENIIHAGCREKGTVLELFSGTGKTGEVVFKSNRKYIGIELNADSAKIAEKALYKLYKESFVPDIGE